MKPDDATWSMTTSWTVSYGVVYRDPPPTPTSAMDFVVASNRWPAPWRSAIVWAGPIPPMPMP